MLNSCCLFGRFWWLKLFGFWKLERVGGFVAWFEGNAVEFCGSPFVFLAGHLLRQKCHSALPASGFRSFFWFFFLVLGFPSQKRKTG